MPQISWPRVFTVSSVAACEEGDHRDGATPIMRPRASASMRPKVRPKTPAEEMANRDLFMESSSLEA